MIISEIHSGIATLTLDNQRNLNALSGFVLTELDRKLDEVIADEEVKVVLITGAGKAFVAGADIAEMKDLSPADAKVFALQGSRVFRRIETAGKVFIAAVNGYALGGGCELAMACDLRLAAENAKFGLPEVGLGIFPGFSGIRRLMELVGEGKAKELVFTGKTILSDEACRIGLVNSVVPQEKLLEAANELAQEILAKSLNAILKAKQAMNQFNGGRTETLIEEHAELFASCFGHEDQKEGMAAFLEKRAPKFK
jgi:enoyl-CoA hydratase